MAVTRGKGKQTEWLHAFYYHYMKRILLSAALTAATALNATAQEVARVSEFEITPSALTSNGKPVPVGIDDEKQEVTIFDTDFNVVKKFNYTCGTYTYRTYSEIATVKPSGAKVTQENSYDVTIDNLPVAANTVSEMTQKLTEIYGNSDYYGFTDHKGRTCCWSPSRTSCYESQWLGATYPHMYYCIEDGYIKEIFVDYEHKFNQDNIDNAEWTISGDVEENTGNAYPVEFEYLDYDANIAFDEENNYTQTLFNDDDKWEYMVQKYGPAEKRKSDYWSWDRNDNGIVLRRTVYEGQARVGYDIKNEDGDIIASINAKGTGGEWLDIFKIGGNLYLLLDDGGDEVLYKYDRQSTEIKEVTRSEAKRANVRVNGRSITVEADGKDVDEVELFDIGGRKMASSARKSAGHLNLNAANAADGVYSVALKKRGRLVGAQKIVLK